MRVLIYSLVACALIWCGIFLASLAYLNYNTAIYIEECATGKWEYFVKQEC